GRCITAINNVAAPPANIQSTVTPRYSAPKSPQKRATETKRTDQERQPGPRKMIAIPTVAESVGHGIKPSGAAYKQAAPGSPSKKCGYAQPNPNISDPSTTKVERPA